MATRTENSRKNLTNGIINQVIILAINFASRTIFIKTLGEQYLGINGLYTNILSLLSLTELGLGNIALYTLYKPLAEKNSKKISQLINFYKKVYFIIFCSVIIIGLVFVPFLKYIIDTNLPLKDLILYYILYLLNTALSYAFINKRILVNADQKVYIIRNTTTMVTVIQFILQASILVVYKDFYLYLIIQCMCTLLTNLIIKFKAEKIYNLNIEDKLPKEEQKSILLQTKDLFIYKLNVTLVNSVDNIFISILLGTNIVGYYSNYNMIILMIINLINLIINSISASIGNLSVIAKSKEKEQFFYKLLLAMQWIISFVSCCMLQLFNDFITLWIGEMYVFSSVTVLIIVMNFYIAYIISPIWIFRETNGLFKEVKYVMLVTAILNIIFTYILGIKYGLNGIIGATILSRLLTTVWYEPKILFKKCFNSEPKKYYLLQLKNIIIFCLITLISYIVTKNIVATNYILWLIKAIIITIIFNGLYIVIYSNNSDFKYIIGKWISSEK